MLGAPITVPEFIVVDAAETVGEVGGELGSELGEGLGEGLGDRFGVGLMDGLESAMDREDGTRIFLKVMRPGDRIRHANCAVLANRRSAR